MTTEARNKQPTLHREPLFPELVIPDLKDMERSGSYDRNALLWLQDGYSSRALREYRPELRELHTRLVESGASIEEARRQKVETLAKFTCELYKSEKASGRGRVVDLKGYIEGAKAFYESESVRYGGHLQELAEYIAKALENGEKPDLERHARQVYVSMAKLSSTIVSLDGISGQSAAQASDIMKRGVDSLNINIIGDQPTRVGRELLGLVNKISKNPTAYIEFRDPSGIEMPERGPWDFEPVHRSDGFTL